MKRAILIAGPTASGKSDLALALAERTGGVIVNADSMQVYADLSILTARPSAADTARVPHRLFGHVDAGDSYSVGRWLSDLRDELVRLERDRRLPIIVGGTGLYLKALTQGLSQMPPIPAALRARLRHEAATLPSEALHARLVDLDPAMAALLRPSDPQRVTRALEVVLATGRSLLAYQGRREPPVLPPEIIAGVCLTLPRAVLHARIDRRFDAMIAAGALDEATVLSARELDTALPAMRAVGVPQLLAVLRSETSLPEAVAAAKRASRDYAKRQVTFARHQLGNLAPVDPADAIAAIEGQLTVR